MICYSFKLVGYLYYILIVFSVLFIICLKNASFNFIRIYLKKIRLHQNLFSIINKELYYPWYLTMSITRFVNNTF